jgi:hypothetical protein
MEGLDPAGALAAVGAGPASRATDCTHPPSNFPCHSMQATDRSAKALKYKAADGSVIGFKEVSNNPVLALCLLCCCSFTGQHSRRSSSSLELQQHSTAKPAAALITAHVALHAVAVYFMHAAYRCSNHRLCADLPHLVLTAAPHHSPAVSCSCCCTAGPWRSLWRAA